MGRPMFWRISDEFNRQAVANCHALHIQPVKHSTISSFRLHWLVVIADRERLIRNLVIAIVDLDNARKLFMKNQNCLFFLEIGMCFRSDVGSNVRWWLCYVLLGLRERRNVVVDFVASRCYVYRSVSRAVVRCRASTCPR